MFWLAVEDSSYILCTAPLSSRNALVLDSHLSGYHCIVHRSHLHIDKHRAFDWILPNNHLTVYEDIAWSLNQWFVLDCLFLLDHNHVHNIAQREHKNKRDHLPIQIYFILFNQQYRNIHMKLSRMVRNKKLEFIF